MSSAKDYLGQDSSSSWKVTGEYLEYNTSVTWSDFALFSLPGRDHVTPR